MLKKINFYYAQSLKQFYLNKLNFLNTEDFVKQIYFLII